MSSARRGWFGGYWSRSLEGLPRPRPEGVVRVDVAACNVRQPSAGVLQHVLDDRGRAPSHAIQRPNRSGPPPSARRRSLL